MELEEETAIVPVIPAEIKLGTLSASSPAALVEGASAMATVLAGVIAQQNLFVNIQGKKHVKVEGWTTLAMMLGVLPREVEVDSLMDGTYVATVELVRMSDGAVVSRASAECGMDEPRWAGMPRYARRSMAATRATSKACRQAFSWIIALAGFEATPAEEMQFDAPRAPIPEPRRKSQVRPSEPEVPAFVLEPDQAEQPRKSNEFAGVITKVDQRIGKGKGKPFWIITVAAPAEEMTFRTFDEKLRDAAIELRNSGDSAIVTFSTDQYGHKATAIERIPF